MNDSLVLGIDQGSSNTRAVVATLDGSLVGTAWVRGANHVYDGMDVAMAAVGYAVDRALVAAEGQVVAVCAGMTGADWPDEYELLRGQLASSLERQAPGAPVKVTNDCIVALRGGTAMPYGAILVAGTGANCAVRSPAGEEFIYGYYHDDELQGGMALGRAALWAVYRAHAGHGPQTSLTSGILRFYGLAEVDELRRGQLAHSLGRPIHDLAPLVFEAADAGDRASRAIVREFGRGAAGLVLAALARFDMLDLTLDVVLSGSIFKGRGPLLWDTLDKALHAGAPRAMLVNARYEPVVGAALLALEQAGVTVDGGVMRRVEASARGLGLVRADAGFDSPA